MPRSLPNRSVTPLIDFIRGTLRGKSLEHNPLRYADKLASRSQPQPNLPGGPYAKTTQIYYYARDGRREVKPPEVVITAQQLQSGAKKSPEAVHQLTPGKLYEPE